MAQTVYPEPRTAERHRRAEAARSVDAFPTGKASGERRAARYAPPPGGPVVDAYERFLRLPPAALLGTLWLLGLALVGSVVLILYVLGTSLATVVGGG